MNLKNLLIILLFSVISYAPVHAADLDKIMERGFIEFAVYDNFPPYSYKGEDGRVKGIDVDLGRAIAKKMGVQAGFRLTLADESVSDDLRNLVWKGHYLAGGPADVMMHAPYDPNFAQEEDKVAFLQPTYKELIAFAIDTNRVRSAMTLDVFKREPIGVEIESLADAYLLGAYGGQLRENVRHYKNIPEAAVAMNKAEISAIMGSRGELEFSLGQFENDFVITRLQTPGLHIEGWELSAAVKADHAKLAERINQIIGELKSSGEMAAIFQAHKITYNPADGNEMLNTAGKIASVND